MFARQKSEEFEFCFNNINIFVDKKHILKDVSGVINQGEMLIVSGPKGCGKTTLLSVLSGQMNHRSSEICFNGQPIDRLRNEIAYVQSQDLFLPTLTVQETLKYTALLRLPAHLSFGDKLERVNDVVNMFDLDACYNIIVQLVPTDIKKKLSIACEMLLNPAVLILDEPTTALTFKDSLDLMKTIKLYTDKTNKSVIVSAQSCHSAVFQMCSKIMFLYEGEMAFYGRRRDLLGFLREMEIPSIEAYNPADKLLELLCEDIYNDDQPIQEKIIQCFNRLRTSEEWQSNMLSTHYTKALLHNDISSSSGERRPESHHINGRNRNGDTSFEYHRWKNASQDHDEIKVLIGRNFPSNIPKMNKEKWLMPYSHEFLVLLARNFHNARRRILFPVSIVQNLYILVICVLIWWRVERREDTIKDRLGLFFFTVVQWAFFALLDAILTFPKELKVINKEQKGRQYRLSAYCLSKTLSEIPLAVLQPCVYMCVIYWVANLNSITAFFGSVGVLMLDVFAAQSIGLFVGTALRPPWTVSVVSLGLLSMMLWGGAFNTPPEWLRWGKYASYFFYGLNAFIVLEFKDAPAIQCLDANRTMIPVCKMVDPLTNNTVTHFDSELVLLVQQINWPLWCYLIVLVGIMLVTRILWYILLRRQK